MQAHNFVSSPLTCSLVGRVNTTAGTRTVDFATLIRYETLGGHGCATRVRLPSAPADEFYVFKGIDFRTFLQHTDETNSVVHYLVSSWHRSGNLLLKMPRHANILPPPVALVTLSSPEDNAVQGVCGSLQPLYRCGDVGACIDKSNKSNERIPIGLKASWCVDMAAAVAHTHRVA